jgi:hypothetical protein
VPLCHRVAFSNNHPAAGTPSAQHFDRNTSLEEYAALLGISHDVLAHQMVKLKAGVPFIKDASTAWKSGK